MLKRNESNIDRALRVIAGIALLVGFFMAPAEAAYKYWLLIGIVPLATGLIGSCPVYRILGLSTCPIKSKG